MVLKELNFSIDEMWNHILSHKEQLSRNVDRILVHKSKESNNFIDAVACTERSEKLDVILTRFNIPKDHDFFFEHPKDHIPGVMLIEAGRQSGTATSHTVYDVDMDQEFILDHMEVKFLGFGNVDEELYAYNYIYDKVIKRGRLVHMVADGYIIQDNKRIAYIKSSWRIIPRAMLNRIKNR